MSTASTLGSICHSPPRRRQPTGRGEPRGSTGAGQQFQTGVVGTRDSSSSQRQRRVLPSQTNLARGGTAGVRASGSGPVISRHYRRRRAQYSGIRQSDARQATDSGSWGRQAVQRDHYVERVHHVLTPDLLGKFHAATERSRVIRQRVICGQQCAAGLRAGIRGQIYGYFT